MLVVLGCFIQLTQSPPDYIELACFVECFHHLVARIAPDWVFVRNYTHVERVSSLRGLSPCIYYQGKERKVYSNAFASYHRSQTGDIVMSTLSRKFVASCRENKIIMVPWRVIEMLNPRHIRRRIRSNLRSRQSPASSITELNTSWSPILTLKSLNSHRWTTWDAQYALLATIFILSISLIESPGPLACTSLAVALLVSLVFPVACQFFLPALPIIAWLVLFYAMK